MQKNSQKNHSNENQGLVISYFGNSVAVEDYDGQVFQCHLRRNQELPVVGDYVNWQLEKGETGVITGIQTRRSILARADGRGKMKPIAANIDVILIVMAPSPIFSEYLVDRYLIAAELLGIQPVIVLNKVDLLNDTTRNAALLQMKPYQSIPYPVILSSMITREGLNEFTTYLKDKTAVLVGPSGVGKSSIISVLSQIDIRVGEVTTKGAGKHTTTATRLYHLPQGGHLIDSPGVREFNLWSVTKKEILQGFREFSPYVSGCKFRDCLHTAEPDCAVRNAAMDGRISAERFASYQAFIKEAQTKSK